jgi:hypothetical protein
LSEEADDDRTGTTGIGFIFIIFWLLSPVIIAFAVVYGVLWGVGRLLTPWVRSEADKAERPRERR